MDWDNKEEGSFGGGYRYRGMRWGSPATDEDRVIGFTTEKTKCSEEGREEFVGTPGQLSIDHVTLLIHTRFYFHFSFLPQLSPSY